MDDWAAEKVLSGLYTVTFKVYFKIITGNREKDIIAPHPTPTTKQTKSEYEEQIDGFHYISNPFPFTRLFKHKYIWYIWNRVTGVFLSN